MPRGKKFSIKESHFGVPLAGETGVVWKRYLDGGCWRCKDGAHYWLLEDGLQTCQKCGQEQVYHMYYVEGRNEARE